LNQTITTKENKIAHYAAVDSVFLELWSVFPKPRNEGISRELFLDAIEGGVDPAYIVSAAKAYAEKTKGTNHRFISGSDSWLGKRGWREHNSPASALAKGAASNAADPAEYWAGCINAGKFVASSAISPSLAREMRGRQLVTDDKLRGVGATW
jgi:hypothetical protein